MRVFRFAASRRGFRGLKYTPELSDWAINSLPSDYVQRPIADEWTPPPLPGQFESLIDAFDDGSGSDKSDVEFPLGDITYFPGTNFLLLNDVAIQRVPRLWQLGELLHVSAQGMDFHAFHATRIRDAIDLAASTYSGCQGHSPRKELSNVYVFGMDTSVLEEFDIFQVPQLSTIFCTGSVVDELNEKGITGWSAAQVFPPLDKHLETEQKLLRSENTEFRELHFRDGHP